jgi:hypothetical protein
MHMIQKLKAILKLILSDVRQAIIGAIAIALVGGTAGLLYLSKSVLSFSIQIANTPTPLWATIVLVLLVVVYVRLKRKNIHSSIITLYQAYGAFWDSKLNMYCLSCMKPLKNSTLGPSIFFCSDPKCNSKHPLKDDFGKDITKQEAINIIKSSANNRLNPTLRTGL